MPVIATVDDLVTSRHVGRFTHLNVDLPRLAQWHPRVVLGSHEGRELAAEIYVPFGEGPFPVLLFLHGGGWYRGSAEDERKLCMQIAEPGVVVVSLDYALAPEHPFPTPLEDCVYAARWVRRHAAEFGGDPTQVAISGASAGANLAAATVAHLHGGETELEGRDLDGEPARFGAGLFLYGFYDLASVAEAARNDPTRNVVPLTAYLGADWQSFATDPRVSPSHARLECFPPCYLTCGDEDGALPQTLAFAGALTRARVPTTVSVVQGADHVFLNIPHVIPGAAPELRRIGEWLAAQLAPPRTAAMS